MKTTSAWYLPLKELEGLKREELTSEHSAMFHREGNLNESAWSKAAVPKLWGTTHRFSKRLEGGGQAKGEGGGAEVSFPSLALAGLRRWQASGTGAWRGWDRRRSSGKICPRPGLGACLQPGGREPWSKVFQDSYKDIKIWIIIGLFRILEIPQYLEKLLTDAVLILVGKLLLCPIEREWKFCPDRDRKKKEWF